MQTFRSYLGLLGTLALAGMPATAGAQPLGSEFQVNTFTIGYQSTGDDHQVAVDANGDFVVVWQGAGSGDADGVWVRRYDSAGTPLGNQFRVNSYTTGFQWQPSVARDPKGNFVVVWESQFGIFGQRFEGSGQPLGIEFRVASVVAGGPSVASGPDGNFVIVWYTDEANGSFGVFGQRFDRRGRALGSQFQVNSYTTGTQAHPTVASDTSGQFVVVWRSDGQDGSYGGVFGQRYDSAGVPQGDEFQVNSDTRGYQHKASVAAAANGSFVVVWASGGGFGTADGIFGQRYDGAGVPLGAEFQVNSHTTGSQGEPSVASDASGNFLVAWDGPGAGDSSGVFGQRYDSAGVPQGAEFRLNSYTTWAQSRVSAAATGTNDFIAVWRSQRQEGPQSGIGVFGTRLQPGDRHDAGGGPDSEIK